MQRPEWLFGGSPGWGMLIHGLWAMPLIFIVSGVTCVLFLMWRAGPRIMHPLSGWHLPHMSHMPFGYETAQQILDRRYASGEITKQQYVEMMAGLRQWEHKPPGCWHGLTVLATSLPSIKDTTPAYLGISSITPDCSR